MSITLAPNNVGRKENRVATQELPPETDDSAMCSKCGAEMVITGITPILFGDEFEHLMLACKKCGSTKVLKIKRR
jgi:DNA-directed RNA polymerase subunit M/transcription elongation factor TFIIS